MTEQYQNPAVNEDTDDTEGHGRRAAAADDVDRGDALADDTEGHWRKPAFDIEGAGDEDDDTEGHWRKPG
jgi:hypothetical protein